MASHHLGSVMVAEWLILHDTQGLKKVYVQAWCY